MARNFSAILLIWTIAACCATGSAVAAAAYVVTEIQAARDFQRALKNNDRNAVARMAAYPVSRDYPLEPVRSAREFLARWNEFFDKANTAALLQGKPEDVGWRGVMLANGLAWFNNKQLVATNLKSDFYLKKLEAAKAQDASSLYPTARGYKSIAVDCSTKTKHVRIQEHGDGYHYFVWPKGASLSRQPELALKGTAETQGSGGGVIYSFPNRDYSYTFAASVMCEKSDCPDTLMVSKGHKQISSQTCS